MSGLSVLVWRERLGAVLSSTLPVPFPSGTERRGSLSPASNGATPTGIRLVKYTDVTQLLESVGSIETQTHWTGLAHLRR